MLQLYCAGKEGTTSAEYFKTLQSQSGNSESLERQHISYVDICATLHTLTAGCYQLTNDKNKTAHTSVVEVAIFVTSDRVKDLSVVMMTTEATRTYLFITTGVEP